MQMTVLTGEGGDLTYRPGHQALSGHQVVVETLQAPV